jgi:protease-4
MEDIYRQFTAKAAAGRKLPVEKLRDLAGGRVYTGRQAKENGLVDELGTLHDAITSAKQFAGLEKDAAVRLEILPEPKSILDSLFSTSKGEKEVQFGRTLEPVAPELASVARKVYRLRAMFDRPAALVMPFELEIR